MCVTHTFRKPHRRVQEYRRTTSRKYVISIIAGVFHGVARIKVYGKQILDALAYLHAKGTVYGDLKCDNVLVDSHGTAKLADFGSAFFFDSSSYKSSEARRSVAGTLNFIAPEVFQVRRFAGVHRAHSIEQRQEISLNFCCLFLYLNVGNMH